MLDEALEVATDPDYRFDLAIQLGKLDIARVKLYLFSPLIVKLLKGFLWSKLQEKIMVACYQEIATQVQSESKWKQLGALALSTGKVFLANSNY